jgi:hypothetical protein
METRDEFPPKFLVCVVVRVPWGAHAWYDTKGRNFFGWCLESEITRATTLRSIVDIQLYSSSLSWSLSPKKKVSVDHSPTPWLTHRRPPDDSRTHDTIPVFVACVPSIRCAVERFLASRLTELVSVCMSRASAMFSIGMVALPVLPPESWWFSLMMCSLPRCISLVIFCAMVQIRIC